MPSRSKKGVPKRRVADEIMHGMRELQRMMDEGKRPEEMFTVRTIEIPDPADYRAQEIRALRLALGVSQRQLEPTGVQCRERRLEPLPLLETWTRHQDHQPIARRLPQNGHANPSETERAAAGSRELSSL